MTLRSFRGGPVWKFETFYLPKKLVIFRVGPVKKNTLYVKCRLFESSQYGPMTAI